jgi:hypothetical protein
MIIYENESSVSYPQRQGTEFAASEFFVMGFDLGVHQHAPSFAVRIVE